MRDLIEISVNKVQGKVQGLSTVEKPNRDFCHQLQDTGQTGLITVKGNTRWTSGERIDGASFCHLWMDNLV